MTKTILLNRKSLLTKIFVLVMLLVGGGSNAWGEGEYTGTLTFSSGVAPSGWTVENAIYSGDYVEPEKSWSTLKVSSSTKIKLLKGQKIIITAKRTAESSYNLKYDYYASSFNSTSPKLNFNSSTSFPTSNTDYALTIDITSDINTYYVAFWTSRVSIKSIEFTAVEEAEEITELTFAENEAIPEGFSSLTSATSIPDVYVKYTPSNGWNTICMPFQLKSSGEEYSDIMNAIFGAGWKAYGVSSYDNGVLTFTRRTTLLSMFANTPYLVYTTDAKSPGFDGFHFENIDVTYSYNPRYVISGSNIFQGTYITKTYNALTDEASPWYGVTPAGKVMKAGTGAAVKGYRAYFTGIEPPTPGARINIVIEDDGGTTDLGFVKMVDPEAKEVYNLQGQKVQKGRKGMYIVNGRKVVIK